MTFSLSRSEGYTHQHLSQKCMDGGHAHLVAHASPPFDHLGNGILVHSPSAFADSIDDREIGLESIQCLHRSLHVTISQCYSCSQRLSTNVVVSCHCGGGVAEQSSVVMQKSRAPMQFPCSIHGRISNGVQCNKCIDYTCILKNFVRSYAWDSSKSKPCRIGQD